MLFCFFGVCSPVSAEAGSPQDDIQTSPADNDKCLLCHDRLKRPLMFANGDEIFIEMDAETYGKSVHAELACTECHEGFEEVFHSELTVESKREFFVDSQESCQNCHPNQFDKMAASVHEELFNAGNQDTPTCANCHDPHSQQQCKEGKHSYEDQMWIVSICADCHGEMYENYTESVHGYELVEEGNVDMPSCIDCHSVHDICDPEEAAFRMNSIDICADCHTDPDIMEKYGKSVNVLDTYLVFHDTTVTYLERYDSESLTNKPTCYDCHGIHNVGEFTPPPIVSGIPGPDQYPSVEAVSESAPAENVGMTAAVLGLMLGGAGTMTISQIIRERKEEDIEDEDEEQGDQ